MLALLNNARHQLKPAGLLAPQTAGHVAWNKEFGRLVENLRGRLSQLLTSAADDRVSEALTPAEPDLVWNFLIEVALNSDDRQKAALYAELSPGLTLVQVRVVVAYWRLDKFTHSSACTNLYWHAITGGSEESRHTTARRSWSTARSVESAAVNQVLPVCSIGVKGNSCVMVVDCGAIYF